eukprot:TRINITY_DN17287_c0_g7_i1.p1 TRINITY_DN17287_c0_g7~~TRINITY_DN17287_c0_g7_i1.p1  ORF type:complete len:261 (+),score=90.02 TRINITY_DN17287_c0_g7_i1:48-830(+)
MTRTPFIGGNFKCTGTASSLTALVQDFNTNIAGKGYTSCEVVVAPATPYIGLVKSVARREIGVSAQNCIAKSGAFTGEMSAEQVKDMGLEYVIIGHSERRHVFGETQQVIAEKVKAALEKGLTVIFCIGETLKEREQGRTEEVCFEQMQTGIAQVPLALWSKIVIAYEPVWAIGTGKVASPDQAQQAVAAVRNWLLEKISRSVASSTRIIYGGSVNAKNSTALWSQPDIDGFLVGGASTKPEFADIVKAASMPKGTMSKL